MKKILETSLGRCSDLYFSDNDKRVGDNEVGKLVVERCNDYSIYSQGGVLVHMTKEMYEKLLKQTE